jgi:hypothetical protein
MCFAFVERTSALYLLTICELNMTKLKQNTFFNLVLHNIPIRPLNYNFLLSIEAFVLDIYHYP